MHLKSVFAKARKKGVSIIRTVAYAGSKVHCLICDWKGDRFFENQRCPRCESLPRTRLIPFAIRFFDLNFNASELLHVGPNLPEYNYLNRKFKLTRYDRLDVSLKKKITNVTGDLTSLPFQNDIYSHILTWHVLEHIPNDRQAIKEMYRVSKNKASLLISVPIYPPFREKTYEDHSIERERYSEVHGHDDHCRSCGLDYNIRFEEVGFKSRTLEVRYLDQKDIEHYGLSTGHICWLFTKQE